MADPAELTATDRVFVLTGAGISAESGIATFRAAGGLWEQHRVEDVASPRGWDNDPALLWRFYSERRQATLIAKPNVAHEALAAVERCLGDRMLVCTQNIDRLHEQAGSQRVVHVHGDLFHNRCSSESCQAPSVEDDGCYHTTSAIPRCAQCGSLMRPDIVWFGEEPKKLREVDEALERCTVYVAIGTSGLVHPVAGFVKFLHARRPTTRTIYVGPEPPANAQWFDQLSLGTATSVVPGLFVF